MRVEIVVDELVLRGVPNERAGEVEAALGTRLAELGRGDGLASREEAFRRAPDVHADSPGALGDAVAGAVWSAVAGGERT
jgi:hypothetical protein